jgi:hypothetical protein
MGTGGDATHASAPFRQRDVDQLRLGVLPTIALLVCGSLAKAEVVNAARAPITGYSNYDIFAGVFR